MPTLLVSNSYPKILGSRTEQNQTKKMWKVNKHIPSMQASDKNKTRSKNPKSQNLSESRKKKGNQN